MLLVHSTPSNKRTTKAPQLANILTNSELLIMDVKLKVRVGKTLLGREILTDIGIAQGKETACQHFSLFST